jgi:hypothetical protein
MKKGKIYLADMNGEAVGTGQPWEIRKTHDGWAAFLTNISDGERFSECYETEADCFAAIKGGTSTVITVDDL